MRVDLTTTFGVEPPENSKSGRAGQSGGSKIGTGGASGPDQTRFSFDQARVQSLQSQVLAQPEIRGAKVQALRQAIGNGEYSVPSSEVANALVNDLAS
jgi:flagellar biosynthesis anti-sigma factor FlgM